MRTAFLTLVFLCTLLLGGCEEKREAVPPAPFALTAEAIGRYCGMNVLEHAGPKGQVILDAQIGEPIWFSSARDTLAFTMLPEEPKDLAAIYVSDMSKAPSWEKPGADNWIDARKAFYVIGSSLRGGMGAEETVPFSTKEAATRFAGEHGGSVVAFADVPREYVLGAGVDIGTEAPAGEDKKVEAHEHG
ncbi:nitrous oxide reductase accessory protein NosL [Rhizobium sp. SRDI969]|jgi:copper chaperone NosL|uniref:nitrous oxide reductase accessory protein NosL n=1 Tax=Rhizobium sp. SRDI969 TaxID=3138252 RepID=UPI0021A502CD|nr:nitrous oxide reductase accessory protein NosL [Rhizobium leguminosarum]UWM84892.1 nitrous oxide reductase accessory protein NosL [Rhizobium leguminosarum bv. viciae]